MEITLTLNRSGWSFYIVTQLFYILSVYTDYHKMLQSYGLHNILPTREIIKLNGVSQSYHSYMQFFFLISLALLLSTMGDDPKQRQS